MSSNKHRPGKRDLPEETTEQYDLLEHVLKEATALSDADEDDAAAEVDAGTCFARIPCQAS